MLLNNFVACFHSKHFAWACIFVDVILLNNGEKNYDCSKSSCFCKLAFFLATIWKFCVCEKSFKVLVFIIKEICKKKIINSFKYLIYYSKIHWKLKAPKTNSLKLLQKFIATWKECVLVTFVQGMPMHFAFGLVHGKRGMKPVASSRVVEASQADARQCRVAGDSFLTLETLDSTNSHWFGCY